MPTERQKLAMQRRISRERFLKARIVEREFAVQLSNAGRQVGQIIKGFERDGKITDMAGLKASLDAYSKTLEPWAKAVVARMQAQVARRDLTAWQQLSKSIGSELHRVIEGAPIGLQLRSMMELQVSLITSLPIEAARRVHTLTLEGITQGRRAEDVQRDIMDSGHVTVSRAKLIARTEVARTASVLTQARATYVGSDSYFWRSSEDSDVRPALGSKHFAEMNTFERGSHRKLDGTIQRWDHPPIAGPQGQRAHPGQIFNCRCWPEPILPDY
jgi:uncharacterized protein with gpF-like domain